MELPSSSFNNVVRSCLAAPWNWVMTVICLSSLDLQHRSPMGTDLRGSLWHSDKRDAITGPRNGLEDDVLHQQASTSGKHSHAVSHPCSLPGLWFLRVFPDFRIFCHQGKKEVACIVSKPLVSCLWGCGESVNPPKLNIQEVQGALSSRPKGHPGPLPIFQDFFTFVKSHSYIVLIMKRNSENAFRNYDQQISFSLQCGILFLFAMNLAKLTRTVIPGWCDLTISVFSSLRYTILWLIPLLYLHSHLAIVEKRVARY